MNNDDRQCLGCEGATKSVSATTVTSLASGRRGKDNEGFRFCPASSCDVVYSRRATDSRVRTAALDVEVFQKSTRSERPVCYCFAYSLGDVRASGEAVIDDIEGKCREGLDRCEEMNPQGRCCLGNVRMVLRTEKREPLQSGKNESCCASASRPPAPDTSEDRPARAGGWATIGAVLAAVLSSACCWLPLSLIALGISAGGIGAFFEAYRSVFLAVTAVLLGAGFYFVYVRKPACGPDEACAAPNPRLRRFNKITLWLATALVGGFALFPNYVGYLIGGAEPTAAAATTAPAEPEVVTTTYAIEGMSCKGCTVHIEQALAKVPTVASATVVYEEKVARVTFKPGVEPDDVAVLAAIDDTGFEATVKNDGDP
ncbi:MAG: mercuric transporter MerT family protein [Polyangiaceae bacterium]